MDELCRKCHKRKKQYYGEIGGYSVQCEVCNTKQSLKRRAAYAKRKKAPAFTPGLICFRGERLLLTVWEWSRSLKLSDHKLQERY